MIPSLSFLPEAIAIPTTLILITVMLLVVGLFLFIIMFAFMTKIPFVKDQLVAQIKKRPGIFIHTITKQLHFHAPKRAGDREERNYLDLAKAIGTYWVPRSEDIEQFDRLPISNYFTKCSVSLPPLQTKAVCDFYNFMNNHGISVNEELIDVMVVHNCDIDNVYLPALYQKIKENLPIQVDEGEITQETYDYVNNLEYEIEDINRRIADLEEARTNAYFDIDDALGLVDHKTGETIITLKKLKKELEQTVIRDGCFVFQQVQDFAMSVAKHNSSDTSETIAIANAEATANSERINKPKDYIMMLMLIATGLTVLVVLYKMMTG